MTKSQQDSEVLCRHLLIFQWLSVQSSVQHYTRFIKKEKIMCSCFVVNMLVHYYYVCDFCLCTHFERFFYFFVSLFFPLPEFKMKSLLFLFWLIRFQTEISVATHNSNYSWTALYKRIKSIVAFWYLERILD